MPTYKSTTKLTTDWLKERNLVYEKVEHWNPFARVRHDLFNIIDIVVLGDNITGIQATSWANVNARIKKSMAEPFLVSWIKAGGKFEVWGWRRELIAPKGPGKGPRKGKWQCKRVIFFLKDGLPDFKSDGSDGRVDVSIDKLKLKIAGKKPESPLLSKKEIKDAATAHLSRLLQK